MCHKKLATIQKLANLTSCRSLCEHQKFIFLIRERGKGEKKGRERNVNGLPPAHTPSSDGSHSPGMCPDWELNP